jgi:hypothetical protein
MNRLPKQKRNDPSPDRIKLLVDGKPVELSGGLNDAIALVTGIGPDEATKCIKACQDAVRPHCDLPSGVVTGTAEIDARSLSSLGMMAILAFELLNDINLVCGTDDPIAN